MQNIKADCKSVVKQTTACNGTIVFHFTYDSNEQQDIRMIERCPKLRLPAENYIPCDSFCTSLIINTSLKSG